MRGPERLYTYVFEPCARFMFARPNEISAAEVMQLFDGYFIANREGMGMDVLRRPFGHAPIDPLFSHRLT